MKCSTKGAGHTSAKLADPIAKLLVLAGMLHCTVVLECHAQPTAPTSVAAPEAPGALTPPLPQEATPAERLASSRDDAGGRADECAPLRVTRLFAGRTFEFQAGCPLSHVTLALYSTGHPVPRGWGSQLPGCPGLGLLRHGWLSVGDVVQPAPLGFPAAVRDALQVPDPSPDVDFQEYLIDFPDLLSSLRVSLVAAKRAAVPALRLPGREPVRLRLDRVHRYLDPGQLAAKHPVRLLIPRSQFRGFAGLFSLLAGMAGTAIGAGLIYADGQRPDRGWLPSFSSELIVGTLLVLTGSTAVIAGITILGITATPRYPAEL